MFNLLKRTSFHYVTFIECVLYVRNLFTVANHCNGTKKIAFMDLMWEVKIYCAINELYRKIHEQGLEYMK